jgi:hypothetical protein
MAVFFGARRQCSRDWVSLRISIPYAPGGRSTALDPTGTCRAAAAPCRTGPLNAIGDALADLGRRVGLTLTPTRSSRLPAAVPRDPLVADYAVMPFHPWVPMQTIRRGQDLPPLLTGQRPVWAPQGSPEPTPSSLTNGGHLSDPSEAMRFVFGSHPSCVEVHISS